MAESHFHEVFADVGMVCWAEGCAFHREGGENVGLAVGLEGLMGQPFHLQRSVSVMRNVSSTDSLPTAQPSLYLGHKSNPFQARKGAAQLPDMVSESVPG